MLGGGTCKCLWLGDNGVTLSMVKRAYQNFNNDESSTYSMLSKPIMHEW
jgi:hypothetical protein